MPRIKEQTRDRILTKTDAIQTLSLKYGAYLGIYVVPACSGNLIEDIMNEGDVGKTFHRFASTPTTVVEERHLIPLAVRAQQDYENQIAAIADLVFS